MVDIFSHLGEDEDLAFNFDQIDFYWKTRILFFDGGQHNDYEKLEAHSFIKRNV